MAYTLKTVYCSNSKWYNDKPFKHTLTDVYDNLDKETLIDIIKDVLVSEIEDPNNKDEVHNYYENLKSKYNEDNTKYILKQAIYRTNLRNEIVKDLEENTDDEFAKAYPISKEYATQYGIGEEMNCLYSYITITGKN
jgi:uncharacterized membrane-anchored protein YjiN (DUF445 family)